MTDAELHESCKREAREFLRNFPQIFQEEEQYERTLIAQFKSVYRQGSIDSLEKCINSF